MRVITNINIKVKKPTEKAKNSICYKEKINANTKGNDMKTVQVQQQKKCQTKTKRKAPEQRS